MWLFHDAKILNLHYTWERDHDKRIVILLEVNQEEDSTPINMCVEDGKVLLVFDDVIRAVLNMNGFYASDEVLFQWDIKHSHPSIDVIRGFNYTAPLLYTSINTSAGSTLEIVCSAISIVSPSHETFML